MEMAVLQRDDGITHVILTGRLDTTGAEEVYERFSSATAAQNRPTLVDLSQVEFLASRGISLLFANSKRLKKTGHQLVLVSPQAFVEGVLRTSKLDRAMPIARGLDEALRIVRDGPGEPDTGRLRSDVSTAGPMPDRESPASEACAPVEGCVRLAIQNEQSELERLSAALRQFLCEHGVPSRAAYAVNLAVDELVVNVMRYAYVDADPHTIDIELAVAGGQAVLRIVDDGRPFDPRRGPALDLHAEDREVGGLGLLLVLDMVDALRYERVEEKNCVEVRVHAAPGSENREEAHSGRT